MGTAVVRSRWPSLTACVLMLPGLPTTATAQAELQGRVLDGSGHRPLVTATVAVPRLGIATATDTSGRYRLLRIPAGRWIVVTRAIGYVADSVAVVFRTDEVVVRDALLHVAVAELPTVAVRGAATPLARSRLADFDARRAAGIGHFIDRRLLDRYASSRLGEIIAANAPGVTLHRGTSGPEAWAASGRNTRAKCAICRETAREGIDPTDAAAGAPASACYMDVYVNGVPMYTSAARRMPLFNLNAFLPSEIEGIEVYTGAGQIPAQYNRTAGLCGVLLIWTRDRGHTTPSDST